MKNKLISILAHLFLIILIFSSCKKGDKGASKVTLKTLNSSEVSSLVALNITEALYNGFGIWSLQNGLTRISIINSLQKRIRVNNTVNNNVCGVVTDTILNYTNALADTGSVTVKGSIILTTLCVGQAYSGTGWNNSLIINESDTKLSLTHKLNEKVTLQNTSVPLNENSSLYLSGPLSDTSAYQYKTGGRQSVGDSFSYVFSNLPINPNSPEYISSGTATFTTSGTNQSGKWNYSGTIEFVADQKVNITINGITYKVTLSTGLVN